MSKIKIEQVDSLDEEKDKDVVRYGDLCTNDSFVWAGKQDVLLRKIKPGYLQEDTGDFPVDSGYEGREVIPVDAKILWCREGGE